MAVTGNARKFFVGTTINGQMTWFSGEQNNSFTINANTIDVSDKSNTWDQFIAGSRNATADVTIFTDDTSAQQVSIINGIMNGTTVFCFIGDIAGTGEAATSGTPTSGTSTGYAFEALVTSVGETNNRGEVSSRDMSLQVTGTPVYYSDTE